MAHQVESMMYAGKMPWHGLGTQLADDDTLDVAKAIVAAGLDWTVSLQELFADVGGQGYMQTVPGSAVVRDTDRKLLGVVGPNWTPLQNADKFAWFQPFLDSRLASLESAGSLQEGKRTWILARINREPMQIVPGDTVEKFILISDSFDGTLAVRCGFTPVRVVCANTLAMAHGNGASNLIRCRHTANVKTNVDDLRQVMDTANSEFEATADQYRSLAHRSINASDLRKYVKQVFEMPEKDSDVSTRSRNILDDIIGRYSGEQEVIGQLLASHNVRKQATVQADGMLLSAILDGTTAAFESGAGSDIPAVRGSMWAAYNAVTDYLTHSRGRTEDSRINSLWYGDSARINAKALSTALTWS